MAEYKKYEGLGLEISGFSEVSDIGMSEPTSDFRFDSPEQIIELLESALQDAAKVEETINRCIQSPESCEPDRIVSSVLALLELSIDLIQKIAGYFQHPFGEEFNYEDARFAVAMAADELRRQRQIVDGIDLDEHELRRVLTQLAQAKGVTTKAAVNVERALCAGMDRMPQLGHFLSLEESRETRRVYGKMRRALLKFERHSEPPPHEEVVSRLRLAGTCFVHLRGHNCYSTLRVEDRFDFDNLWDRVYGWLKAEAEEKKTYQGWLIWEDVLNFVDLLSAINFRQELREHDTALATEVLAKFDELDAQSPIGEEIAGELSRLTGYNPAIDGLIEMGAQASASMWHPHLSNIQRGG